MRTHVVAPAVVVALAASLLTAATPAAAQEVGVKGGLSFTSMSYNVATGTGDAFLQNSAQHKARAGFVAGFFVVTQVRPSLSLQGEALITTKGWGTNTDKVRLTYLEIPLLARLGLSHASGPSAYVVTGPALAFKLGASEGSGSTSVDIGSEINGFDWGWVIGAGVDLVNGLTFDARYTVGLVNIASTVSSSQGSIKNRSFALMAGLKFGK